MSDRTDNGGLLHFPIGFLPALHRALRGERSESEAASLLREIGLESGEEFLARFRTWLQSGDRAATPEPEDLSPDEFWRHLSDFFAGLGWGTLEYEQIHPGLVALTSRDWVEADRTGSQYPSCHLTTALLADLLRRVADQELASLEVECRAAGDDRCRFLIGSPDALQRVFDSMREGVAVGEAVGALG
jgi:uncharacterized protein